MFSVVDQGDGLYITQDPEYASLFAGTVGQAPSPPTVYQIRLKEGTKLFDYQSENDIKVAEDFYNKNKKRIDNFKQKGDPSFMERIQKGDYLAIENPFGDGTPAFQTFLQEQGYDGHKTGEVGKGGKELGNIKVYSEDSIVSAFDPSLQQQQQFATAGTDPAGIASLNVDPDADTTVTTDTTVDPNVDTTVDTTVDPNVDTTVTTDATIDTTATTATTATTDTTPGTTVDASGKVTVPDDLDDDDDDDATPTEVEVDVDEDPTDTTPSETPSTNVDPTPTGPIVPPDVETDPVTGEKVYKCPDGYKLTMGKDGAQCYRTITEQFMRAGIGTRAYTSVRPSRTRPGQKSIDIGKVETVAAEEA